MKLSAKILSIVLCVLLIFSAICNIIILSVFFASLNWQKLQSIFGEYCISKMAKVAMA